MSLTKDPKIANMFMLAHEYNGSLTYPVISMPKLDGVRAMYIPGCGFWSRDGVQYSPAVTDHIKIVSNVPVDGEFYKHGWKLQRINAAIGVNLDQPTEDTKEIYFVAYDVVVPFKSAAVRMALVEEVSRNSPDYVESVYWGILNNQRDVDDCYNTCIKDGYEGQMLKLARELYTPGRTRNLLKRKAWKFKEVQVVALHEGKNSLAGYFGGARVRMSTGVEFNCGGGEGLTDDVRRQLWLNPERLMNKWIKIRYREESAGGTPLNATIVL